MTETIENLVPVKISLYSRIQNSEYIVWSGQYVAMWMHSISLYINKYFAGS